MCWQAVYKVVKKHLQNVGPSSCYMELVITNKYINNI
jgi:hypothetical protein